MKVSTFLHATLAFGLPSCLFADTPTNDCVCAGGRFLNALNAPPVPSAGSRRIKGLRPVSSNNEQGGAPNSRLLKKGKSKGDDVCLCDEDGSKFEGQFVSEKKCCKGVGAKGGKGKKAGKKKKGDNGDTTSKGKGGKIKGDIDDTTSKGKGGKSEKINGMGEMRRVLEEEGDSNHVIRQTRPEGSPKFGRSIALSEEAGIWILPEFLDDDAIETMLEAFVATEKFQWDCKWENCKARPSVHLCQGDPDRASLTQPEHKQCVLMTDNVKELLPESSQVAWEEIKDKMQALWPQYPATAPLLGQIQVGEVGPLKWHIDGRDLNEEHGIASQVTTVVYLTDHESKLIFPNVDIEITPKAGMAVTFFNADEDNKILKSNTHGVQASGPGSGARISISFRSSYAPEIHSKFNPFAEMKFDAPKRDASVSI